MYFEGLTALFPAELGFTGRNRKPPRDPVNAALSLSYVLLYADAAIAAHQAGLDPFVGFLHKPEFGRHSLACDLMEPARPLVDRFVLDLFESGLFTLKAFRLPTPGALSQRMPGLSSIPPLRRLPVSGAECWQKEPANLLMTS